MIRRLTRVFGWYALLLIGVLLVEPAWSHEVRPAYLQITETPDGRYDVLWKQPVMGTMAVRLVPHISGGLLEREPSRLEVSPGFHIRLWRDLDAGPQGLHGRSLWIEGLERTITDVMVSIIRADGGSTHTVLRPQSPGLTLDLRKTKIAVPDYLLLGIGHVLSGIDHLCFVLGLLLLVRQRRTLLITITAFTVAHSITLAESSLNVIHVRSDLIEALVALSIVIVAVELVHFHRERQGLTARYPWLIAFGFGLLHGFAFAGALNEIGLPQDALFASLLLFNLGVEAGQLAFIAAMLLAGWLLAHVRIQSATRRLAPYAIGSLAGFWLLDRLGAALAA